VSGLAEHKAVIRKAAGERRAAAFASGDRALGAARLTEALALHAGKVVSGYMPIRSEIDPLPAMAAHRGPVCVPIIDGPGLPLRFRAWTPSAVMVAGGFGTVVPASGDWLRPEVLVVPLLAFDRRGFRLGYGGGFYDRTLEGLRREGPVIAIGFAWAAQEMDEVPIEPTDQPLDLIVTEAGTIRPL
jgi:5-formyltetrahydrofolate cyclo-ligase